jgi:hypothetical protein
VKLYLVHCGFYDADLFEAVYESHVNFFVVAENFEGARVKAKEHPEYKRKRMHVDGLQEIQVIDGYDISLSKTSSTEQNIVISSRHRELAPPAKGS